ncbi:MAG: UbiD family decarboxylase, partial [Helicobacter sp.]|nr:UbiD family decarboxylase [Helicobacter sp.]
MRNFVNRLIELDLLRVINEPVDVELEMAHIAYIEVKKQDAKALLFTRPMRQGRIYEIPVLMNLFGSPRLVAAILGDVERLADNVGKLLRPKPPKSMAEGRQWLGVLWQLAHIFPKRTRGRGLCHEVIRERENVNLYELPILKTWEKDAAPFITMGQVYAQSLDGKVQNLGMYRLQLRNERELALHWQIHKDSVKMFESYREAGQKMPVSVALGGDPLYTWCATAPLPYGIFELLLYGYIRQSRARLVRCVSNPLYVPHDADIVIEGWVDVNRLEPEGPFGDHTGFY